MARRSNTGFTGISFGMAKPAGLCYLLSQLSTHAFGKFYTVRVNCGGRQNKTHDDCRNVARNNADKDRGRAKGSPLQPLADDQNNHQHEQRQQQIFHRAEILRGVAAAEGIDADRDQRQTDTQHDRAGNDRRKEFAQRLEEKAKYRLKQAAENGRTHNRAIRNHTAAHGSRNAVEHAG